MNASLLIPEPPLQVLPSLAAEIGVNEAIVLQQIHYWSLRVGEDAEGWVYNTQAEWLEQFPWLTERTLRRVIERLRECDLIETRQPEGTNRRLHYRISYATLAASHPAKVDASSGQIGRLSNTSETSTEKTSVSPSRQKVNRKAVTDSEYALAAAVVRSFNEIAGTALRVDPHLTPIVGRIRERPELNGNHHRQIIEAVFAGDHWWKGAPGPRIIYGNAAQFEQSIELARAAAKKNAEPKFDVNAEMRRVRKEQGLDD